jgi:hypothetical protein
VLLGHRDRDGVAVHGRRRGEDHLPHPGIAGRFSNVVRAADVDVERLPRLVDALVQPERREMEDVIAGLRQRPDEVDIGDRAFDHPHPRVLRHSLEILSRAADEVVQHDDLPNGLLEKLLDDVGADEARSTGHENGAVRDLCQSGDSSDPVGEISATSRERRVQRSR